MKAFVYQADKKAHGSRLVALYIEKKPDKKDWDKDSHWEILRDEIFNSWQKTLIGYTREPGFKVGDEVCLHSNYKYNCKVTDIYSDEIRLFIINRLLKIHTIIHCLDTIKHFGRGPRTRTEMH